MTQHLKSFLKSLAVLLIFSSFTGLQTSHINAAENQADDSQTEAGITEDFLINNVWAKPNFGPNGAVYLTLANNAETKRHLTGATSPLAPRIEIHKHIHEDGLMKMRHVSEGIDINPKQTVTFEPGGLHLMLFKMTKKLKEGDSLPLTLQFEDGEEIEISVEISNKPVKN